MFVYVNWHYIHQYTHIRPTTSVRHINKHSRIQYRYSTMHESHPHTPTTALTCFDVTAGGIGRAWPANLKENNEQTRWSADTDPITTLIELCAEQRQLWMPQWKGLFCSPTAMSTRCVPDTHWEDNAKVRLHCCECQHRLQFNREYKGCW